ncbi:hypothetical protein BLOT_012872 [Blomia tropicalis]|nr:hypothetical protein BLOT_012872 [Blomia tropicalis]
MNSNGLIMSDEQNVETVVDAVTSTISIEPIEISSSINGHDHHHLNLLYLDETELEIDTELEAETIIHQNGTDTISTEDETKTSEYLFDCSIDQHETTDNESDCDDSSSIGSIVEIRTNNSVATDQNSANPPSSSASSSTPIGRAIARVRPSSDNAIFDCKVLSRNHALMWHQDGKFYLRDTCSSNGTFINNVRLSLANEKSNPQEIFSGDCLQFGIEVTEKKQIHNCVIATVRLFQPDGTEAKPEGNVAPVYNGMVDHFSNKSLNSSLQYINSEIITPFQLFELAHYLQEAQSKQMMLEEQIDKMKTLITTAVESTKSGWNSVFAEDQLLTRIESLQSKFEVVLFARAHDDDTFSMEQRESIIETLKNELLDLINEKERFKNQWKFAIAKAFEEKTTAQTNLYSVELQLHTKSEHCKQLELTIKQNLKEMENLINGLDKAHNDYHELTTKLRLTEDEATKMRSQLETDKNNLEKQIFALKEENIAHLKMIAKQQDEIGMNGSMKKDVSNCESVMISTIKHETKIGLTIETSQQTDNDDNGLSEFHHQSLQAELIELKELYNGQCVQLRSQQDELTRFNRWLTENGPKCRQFWHILNENLTKIDKKLNEKYRKLSKLIDDLYCFIGKFNKAKGIVLNEIKVLKENNEILKMNSAESNETIGQLNVVINNCEQNLNELRIKHEQVLEEKNQLLLKVEHQQYEKAKLEMSTAKTMVSTLIQTDPMLEEQSNQQQQQQQQFQLPHDSLDSSKQSNEIQNEQLKQIVNLLKDRVPNYSEEESLLAKLNVLLDDGERLRNENSQLSANLYNVQQQYTLLSYQNELSFCMALFPLCDFCIIV